MVTITKILFGRRKKLSGAESTDVCMMKNGARKLRFIVVPFRFVAVISNNADEMNVNCRSRIRVPHQLFFARKTSLLRVFTVENDDINAKAMNPLRLYPFII